MGSPNTYNAKASIVDLSDLRVCNFVGSAETPGNVGVAVSGGGSRAMIASMGQLRSLHELGFLSKVKAMSSSSGGSWTLVPYAYAPSDIRDSEILGTFVDDPSALTLLNQGNLGCALDHVEPRNLASAIDHSSFNLVELVARALELKISGVPADRLWCHLIGDQTLERFGLSEFDKYHNPVSFFTNDAATAAQILEENPHLPKTWHGIHVPEGGDSLRPFPICNFGMFVADIEPDVPREGGYEYLATLQGTPFFVGACGSGIGRDSSGCTIGGAGMTPFAFSSTLKSVSGDSASVAQNNAFALSDLAGASSTAFAEMLENKEHDLLDLVPRYHTWSPSDPKPPGAVESFADSGNVENSAINSLLAYADIDQVIALLNSETALVQKDGEIVIDTMVPPLFGFQPWQAGAGYVLYPPPNSTEKVPKPVYRFNKVFPSECFQALLDALWSASSGAEKRGRCVVEMEMPIVDNQWYGVRGGRKVRFLWVYLERDRDWDNQLHATVKLELPSSFPHYSTAETSLTKIHANLLAHFSSWTLAQEKERLEDFFK